MANISGQDELVTKQELRSFYQALLPYLSNNSSGASYTAGDGISIDDGEISTDNMQSGDMDDVVTPLPSIPTRGIKYSTDEQVIGEWLDGSPLYQKTIDCGSLPNNAYKTVAHGISNFNRPVRIWGVAWNNSSSILLPYLDDDDINARINLAANATEVFIGARHFNASSYTYSAITLQYTKTTD